MTSATRPVALDALTDGDTMSIGIALIGYIKEIEHSLATGGGADYWEPRLTAARCALARVLEIRAAS